MKSTRARRVPVVAATLAATAILVTACSTSSSSSSTPSPSASSSVSGTSSPSSSAAAMTPIVVGALPVLDTAGLQVAIKEGFFTKAGLNVTVKSVAQSTVAIPDLLHGSIDIIGGGNYVSFLEAQANGAFPVQFLAPAVDCTANDYGVVALPSSGITTASGLAGKTVAVNLTKNIQTLTTDAVLKSEGVGAVSYVQIPFPDMVSALKAGRVSAISVVEPFLAAALKAGGKLVASTCTGPTADFPMSGYITTQTWSQQHPAAAKAFQQALEEGNAYADAHPSVVRSVLPSYTSLAAQAAATVPLGTYPSTLTTTPLQRIATLMKASGLATPSDLSALLLS
jgi:NitT/TauT family transport system substrate-binding protein